MIIIDRLDHLVLTVADIERSCDFYQRVLGMQVVRFGAGRVALQVGQQKINLHPASAPLQPHALLPTRGSADLCLITPLGVQAVLAHLQAQQVPQLLRLVHLVAHQRQNVLVRHILLLVRQALQAYSTATFESLFSIITFTIG